MVWGRFEGHFGRFRPTEPLARAQRPTRNRRSWERSCPARISFPGALPPCGREARVPRSAVRVLPSVGWAGEAHERRPADRAVAAGRGVRRPMPWERRVLSAPVIPAQAGIQVSRARGPGNARVPPSPDLVPKARPKRPGHGVLGTAPWERGRPARTGAEPPEIRTRAGRPRSQERRAQERSREACLAKTIIRPRDRGKSNPTAHVPLLLIRVANFVQNPPPLREALGFEDTPGAFAMRGVEGRTKGPERCGGGAAPAASASLRTPPPPARRREARDGS